MKLELGGGVRARGDGWVNMDCLPVADICHDLDTTPWPIQDNSVDEVYSSHCLEHLKGPFAAFAELCRICKIGAKILICVPHPNADLAMTWSHLHCFSPLQALNMEKYFPEDFWKLPKRMKLERVEYRPTVYMDEAKKDLPFIRNLSDEVIMKWIPRTCHECCFHYVIIENEHFKA